MLRLSDFLTYRTRYYNQSRCLYLSFGTLWEDQINPLSPKIDFYVDISICATSWASNHTFMLLSKIFQEAYHL